jgi:gas vesicle protein
METVVGTLAGIIAGIVTGWFFFHRSGKQLDDAANALLGETKKLRDTTNQITRALEEGGIATFNRDAKGEVVGLVFSRNVVNVMGFSQLKADGTVVRPESPPPTT